jgi:hypothetical protein
MRSAVDGFFDKLSVWVRGDIFGTALAMQIISEVCMNRSRWSEWIKGALLYFAAVFGSGFILGTVRILLLVPRIGVRSAELLEIPLMIIISVFAARWAVRRAGIQNSRRDRLLMGSLALIFMMAAELAMTVLLRNESIVDAIANRDPVSGTAYLFAIALFGLMPWIVGDTRAPSEYVGSIDEFIPDPDISESHDILVKAPAEIVFNVAVHLDIRSIPVVDAIFKLRECIFRLRPDERPARSLVAETLSLGWEILAYRSEEELVMGTATQPWVGNVKFRPIPPAEFRDFAERDFVKIVWTIEVEPVTPEYTRFRTQTRVRATDSWSRARFRIYWAFAGPLIVLIRKLVNREVRRRAEELAHRKDSDITGASRAEVPRN